LGPRVGSIPASAHWWLLLDVGPLPRVNGRVVFRSGGWCRAAWALGALVATIVALPRRAAATSPPEATRDPVETYQQGFVDFESSVAISGSPFSAGRTWVPYLGKYHRTLSGVAFYETIERPDLVRSYRRRQIIGWSLLLGGIGSIAGGLYLGSHGSGQPEEILIGAGIVALIAGHFIDADPVDEVGARQAADEFNKSFKRRLGLAPPPPAPAGPRRPTPELTFIPLTTQSACGVGVVGTF
jgi:hypothetical protein